jgi:NAD-dependent dihydropyrimidine dehydrogenase PreA subunit
MVEIGQIHDSCPQRVATFTSFYNEQPTVEIRQIHDSCPQRVATLTSFSNE